MHEIGVVMLHGAVQHYDWGGRDFIPALLGIANRDRKPFAELWIGAHPNAPSMADVAGMAVPLDRLIAEAPDKILGPSVSARCGENLPYLLKVLDAAEMLSIQAHPAKAQAVDGFARENADGVGLDAAERNYKDESDKPEMAVALTDFWMLHGFRPLDQIAETLRDVPELCSRLAATPPSDQNAPDYWAARALASFPPVEGHRDRGIFSIYLLNLVHLRPGQGTFQPAGMLHSYLEGVTVELMANSDNVLRGGLTRKHVDVGELMKIVSFDSGGAKVLEGEPTGESESVYRTPPADFELSRICLSPGGRYLGQAFNGPESVIVLNGTAILTASGHDTPLARGAIFFAPFGVHYSLHAGITPAMFFKASVSHPRGMPLA
jgi:mannose-6-phosphate isomerase